MSGKVSGKSKSGKAAGGDPSGKSQSQSRSAKAGLQFPVGRIHRLLKKGNYAQRVGAGAPGALFSLGPATTLFQRVLIRHLFQYTSLQSLNTLLPRFWNSLEMPPVITKSIVLCPVTCNLLSATMRSMSVSPWHPRLYSSNHFSGLESSSATLSSHRVVLCPTSHLNCYHRRQGKAKRTAKKFNWLGSVLFWYCVYISL